MALRGAGVFLIATAACGRVAFDDTAADSGAKDTAVQRIVPPGCFAHWGFDEGSGTLAADSCGNGLDGTLQAGASWTIGTLDGAVRCDGNSNCVIAAPIELTSSSFTFAAWVRSSDRTGPQTRIMGISYYVRENGFAWLSFGLGQPWLEAQDDTSSLWGTTMTGTSIADAAWHHVASIVDRAAGQSRLFVDGSVVTQNSTVSTGVFGDPSPTEPFAIGGQGPTRPDLALAADIDDAYVYLRALSDAEIADLAR
jgi:hypothetical protein